MAETFQFELVSPERVLMSIAAEQVVVPGSEGDFAVLPRHAPLISMLRPGLLQIALPDSKVSVFVKGGFAQMDEDTLTILVERAFEAEKLDAAGLASEIAATESELASATDDAARKMANDALDALRTMQPAAR